ncbi:MAG: hypothetical protein SAL70_35645 [Scytonema sp. PMC 1070.18]|nr:hypothetical protein [Scytonema sp. PMC 1070.18]
MATVSGSTSINFNLLFAVDLKLFWSSLDNRDRSPVVYGMAEIFDDIAQTLQNMGFEVIRNPLPITYVDYPEFKTRSWYFATANNCLIQIDSSSGNDVWLPTYGHGDWMDLAVIDAENKRIWEELGFKVHQLADFHPFAQNLGSVHCIKKYIERS